MEEIFGEEVGDENAFDGAPGAITKEISNATAGHGACRAGDGEVHRAVESAQGKSDEEEQQRRGKETRLNQSHEEKNPDGGRAFPQMQDALEKPGAVARSFGNGIQLSIRQALWHQSSLARKPSAGEWGIGCFDEFSNVQPSRVTV